MARAATVLLVVWALLLAGCGEKSPRERVERYIEDVTAVQVRTNASLVNANKTYAAFSRGKMRSADGRKRLVAAEKSIRGARAELAELRPPAEARALHARLLRYYDDSADLAYETSLLGRYEPAAQSALRALPRLNGRLQSALATGTGTGDQVAALSAYARGLDRVLGRLRAVQPPPILLAAHNDQVARLARTSHLADQLLRALREQDARAIAKLLLRFRRAGGSASNEVTRLSSQAVRAYPKRVRGLTVDAAAVERERRRLEQTLN